MPQQPDESAWRFVEDLQSPLWTRHNWTPRARRETEADLSRGVTVVSSFPDDARVLATSFNDLETFLRAGEVPTGGDYKIEIEQRAMEVAESYRLEIGADKTAIFAADSEGVRRAIFQLEDEMLRAVSGAAGVFVVRAGARFHRVAAASFSGGRADSTELAAE